MRKIIIPLALILTICLLCTACGSASVSGHGNNTSNTDKPIDTTKPTIVGEATYVGTATLLVESNGETYSVLIKAENGNSATTFHVGDTVTVYYNYKIVAGHPKQIVDVHAIVVKKCVN